MGMLIDTLSVPLDKALAANSSAGVFASLDLVVIGPTLGDTTGVYTAGSDAGAASPNRVRILPFCEGTAGASFSLRMYAWLSMHNPTNYSDRAIWVPMLLAEFACISCNRGGPPQAYPGPSRSLIKETEYFCDTITLVQGNLGKNGYITSTGPGTDLIASVMLDLQGCRRFQFDFQQTDPVNMNALYGRA